MGRYVGLMSGTSMDGIDAVLVRIDADGARVEHRLAQDYAPALADRLACALDFDGLDALELVRLDAEVGEAFAATVNALLASAGVPARTVTAIGSHGQTLFHAPRDRPALTVQIGDPNIIAARTGITVVADFRRRDLALGGEGAPLAPAFHQAMFASDTERRCVVNIGGIANVTVCAEPGRTDPVGFDSGPGNTLLDQWCRRHTGAPCDLGGQWARRGRVLPALLETLLADPYFALPAPKSTGREYFNLPWLEKRLAAIDAAEPADVQHTLTLLTARSIAAACHGAAEHLDAVYICGGGAQNALLMSLLHEALGNVRVETTTALGIDPQDVEGVAFAWLARRTLRGETGNVPGVTGAAREAPLGAIHPGVHGLTSIADD